MLLPGSTLLKANWMQLPAGIAADVVILKVHVPPAASVAVPPLAGARPVEEPMV